MAGPTLPNYLAAVSDVDAVYRETDTAPVPHTENHDPLR
jgi:hypothetical protein